MKDRKQIIKDLSSRGYTYGKIGEIVGISKQRVHQILTGYISPANFLRNQSSLPTKIPSDWLPPKSEMNGIGLSGKLDGIDRLAEIVRRRDNWTCQICGKIWEKGKRRFDVHHLDPECESKKTYENYKKFDRMITLCHKCHLNLEHIKNNQIKIKEINKVGVEEVKINKNK